MTIAEFIKKRIIIESQHDYMIDVPAAFALMTEDDDPEDPNEMQIWMEDFLYPLLNEEEIEYINTQDFPDNQSLTKALKAKNYYYAVKIIKAAFAMQIRRPTEPYYINDIDGIHVVVPLKFLK